MVLHAKRKNSRIRLLAFPRVERLGDLPFARRLRTKRLSGADTGPGAMLLRNILKIKVAKDAFWRDFMQIFARIYSMLNCR